MFALLLQHTYGAAEEIAAPAKPAIDLSIILGVAFWGGLALWIVTATITHMTRKTFDPFGGKAVFTVYAKDSSSAAVEISYTLTVPQVRSEAADKFVLNIFNDVTRGWACRWTLQYAASSHVLWSADAFRNLEEFLRQNAGIAGCQLLSVNVTSMKPDHAVPKPITPSPRPLTDIEQSAYGYYDAAKNIEDVKHWDALARADFPDIFKDAEFADLMDRKRDSIMLKILKSKA